MLMSYISKFSPYFIYSCSALFLHIGTPPTVNNGSGDLACENPLYYNLGYQLPYAPPNRFTRYHHVKHQQALHIANSAVQNAVGRVMAFAAQIEGLTGELIAALTQTKASVCPLPPFVATLD